MTPVLVALIALALVAAGFSLFRTMKISAELKHAGDKQRKRPAVEVVEAADDEEPPRVHDDEEEPLDMTLLTVPSLEMLDEDEDEIFDDETTTTNGEEAVVPIVFDEEAAMEEPTRQQAFFLVSAVGQSSTGKRRHRNEDSYLMLNEPRLYAIADGMGGYFGGDVASKMAVEAVQEAMQASSKKLFEHLPRRASEVAQAMLIANLKVWERARLDEKLEGMGTTFVCARFSPRKERVYIGHVGDSRCYRLRDGELTQVTTDHTLENKTGAKGPMGTRLTRAIGVQPRVEVDVIIGRPRVGDTYLLCSDGLNKMVSDEKIREILIEAETADAAVEELVQAANDAGGKDNVTAIVVDVEPMPEPQTTPSRRGKGRHRRTSGFAPSKKPKKKTKAA